MAFGIDSVVLEPGIHRTPILAAHRAKQTNTVPGITYILAVATQRSDSDPHDKTSPHVDESQPEHPPKLINLSKLIGRDARFSLLVCAVAERFLLVPYRSFDVDCFIGIHGILLPPLAKAIQTPNLWNSLFRLWPDDENCLKHRQIAIFCKFFVGAAKESAGSPACI